MSEGLFPITAIPQDFSVGDPVRKWVSERSVTPYVGVVTNLLPSIYKVDVQWPRGNVREDPEELIKVHPIFGLPTVKTDSGYSSYDKSVSEKLYGQIPKRMGSSKRMSLRIAHTFANKVIGNLIDNICEHQVQGLSDIQAYDRIYRKYSSICSDHVMRTSIEKIYKEI